jgi:hypothetical protein
MKTAPNYTLGGFCSYLYTMKQDLLVAFYLPGCPLPTTFAPYSGQPDQLALGLTLDRRKKMTVVKHTESMIGKKVGSFVMGADTTLWVDTPDVATGHALSNIYTNGSVLWLEVTAI